MDRSERSREETVNAQRQAERMADEMKNVAAKLAGSADFREILQRFELLLELQRKATEETEKKARQEL